MVTKEDIKEKLNIIGLDLDNLPQFLNENKPIIFNPSRLNNDKELKVYKYISIKDIEIYCTTSYRDDSIKEKYTHSLPLGEFIKLSAEDPERTIELLRVFQKISEVNIKKIDFEQSKMAEKIPFLVHYNRNQLWQIYYSQETDRYFMLASLKEDTFDYLFYLLKKKIELENSKKDEKIYVPISYVNYSEEFLSTKQINDIENYLWVFTKNWSLTYEVHDINDKLTLQIVGETPIYENLKSMYKIILDNKEQAETFYKLIKALFIMQTELGGRYNFTTQINDKNGIEFMYEDKKISYSDLPDFIKDKYISTEADIKKFNLEAFDLEKKLKKLKEESKKKDAEYFIKQKEITTFLECKKSFFGKVRYFFSKKKNKQPAYITEEKEEEKEENKNSKPIQGYSDDKKYHTIDDLVTAQSLYEKSQRYVKDLKQDIKALEIKIASTDKKIKNATTYINEIDEHKKSIFEFWKFANKDDLLALDSGSEEYSNNIPKIKKVFDYDYDFEDIGISYDKLQRTKFSKQELDSIFIACTNVLPIINMLKNKDMNKDAIDNLFRDLKSEYLTSTSSYSSKKNDFDIFGSMKDDSTKVRYLNNKSHRENEKDKYQILDINKKIDVFEFTEKLEIITSLLNKAIHKNKFDCNISLYKVAPANEKVHKSDYCICDMNAERELQTYDNRYESAVKLFKFNFKEGFPAVLLTNIIYYDNLNNTLPVGMDVNSKLLIDNNMFEFKQISKEKIKTNRYFNMPDQIYPRILTVYVEEYDVDLKDDFSEDDKIKPKTNKHEDEKVEDNNQDKEKITENDTNENIDKSTEKTQNNKKNNTKVGKKDQDKENKGKKSKKKK